MKVVYSLLLLLQLCAAQDDGGTPVAAPAPAPPAAPIPFTSTEELYAAVDDYIANGGVNTTSSAITYGYPIGTWDVSGITDFTSVFDPNRGSAFEDFDTTVGYMNYDVSTWDVSNGLTFDRMFRATTFNGNLTVSAVHELVNAMMGKRSYYCPCCRMASSHPFASCLVVLRRLGMSRKLPV